MKILIISALPFDISSSTRAFKTYFNLIDKDDLAQIYTNGRTASTDYCGHFFQITDKRIIKNAFGWKGQVGIEINATKSISPTDLSTIEKSSLLKKDYGFLHLIRMKFWKEKRWFTSELKNWIENFGPDCIFYHNSNSLFMANIALSIADHYKLPLITEISDDYCFNKRPLPLLFSTIYRKKYLKTFEKLSNRSTGCFYISDRMMEKYRVFNFKNADVIHVSSEGLNLKDSKAKANTYCYFGNTGFNRDKTLIALGEKLNELDSSIAIDIYSPLLGNGKKSKLENKKGIKLEAYLPYNQLVKQISSYEYIVVAEPLDKKSAKYISMSLSTKVGDSISSLKKIICIGNPASGTIDYFSKKNCSYNILSKNELRKLTLEKLNNFDWRNSQKECDKIFKNDFSIEANSKKACNIISKAITDYRPNEN